MNCNRKDCTGVIEDGYCSLCGLKPMAESAEPSRRVNNDYSGASITPTPSLPGPANEPRATSEVGSSPSRTTGRTTSTRSTGRGNLGAGLVDVAPVAPRDPASVVLVDPQVPESRRFCGSCNHSVGRGRDGQPGRTEGFCPECGHPFSFAPKLHPGDLVADQYHVVGCIAHGGLGWIYLAQDRKLSDRLVVLKGLLDSGDASAMSAAIAERQFLAQVEHPHIVKIFNFAQHDGAGYIVMEYVGGQSLQELRRSGPAGAPQPLPAAQAIAFVLAVLPAFEYLHARNLLFCDFKPDNVIQTEEQVKLIDLGGVHRLGDDESDLYGTIGYQAPEVPRDGPTVSSDLYTVGRTLAVLTFEFRGYQDPSRYATTLPPVEDVAVFGRYPPFHRFLQRATDTDATARFESAAEMAEQLMGVLRQVVAIDGDPPPSAPSARFTDDLLTDVDRPSWRDLPVPRVDPTDPGAATLANLSTSAPDQLVAALEQEQPTAEIRFRLARARLEIGDLDGARDALDDQDRAEGVDWRSLWWRGVWLLAAGRFDEARHQFATLARLLPGELAPLLGEAGANELAAADLDGDSDVTRREELLRAAVEGYDRVSTTDPSYAGAGFGLARTRAELGERSAAADALDRIPRTSIHSTPAAAARCQVLCRDLPGAAVSRDDLVAASSTLERLVGQGALHHQLARDVLSAALELLDEGAPPDTTVTVAGCPFDEIGVRTGLERTCRALARTAPSDAARIELIDEANHYRPRSLV